MTRTKFKFLKKTGEEHDIPEELLKPHPSDKTGSADLRQNLSKGRWDLAAQSFQSRFDSNADKTHQDYEDLAVMFAAHITKVDSIKAEDPPKFLAETADRENNAYDIQVREVLGNTPGDKKALLSRYDEYLQKPFVMEQAKRGLLKKFQVEPATESRPETAPQRQKRKAA